MPSLIENSSEGACYEIPFRRKRFLNDGGQNRPNLVNVLQYISLYAYYYKTIGLLVRVYTAYTFLRNHYLGDILIVYLVDLPKVM